MISKIALVGGRIIQITFVLAVGYQIYNYIWPSGAVRISTSINDGTLLNHGQKAIDITLPNNVSFESFGGCNPHWVYAKGRTAWHSITCNVEKLDFRLGGFIPTPPGDVWIEQK
jgi:hypothetical protein